MAHQPSKREFVAPVRCGAKILFRSVKFMVVEWVWYWGWVLLGRVRRRQEVGICRNVYPSSIPEGQRNIDGNGLVLWQAQDVRCAI